MYTELMLLWFHLVFNLNTKHDIITNALTSIVGIFTTENGDLFTLTFIDFVIMYGDSSTMASASHLLTAVDVAGQLQDNIRISLIQVGYA